jgi:hypothetical protein
VIVPVFVFAPDRAVWWVIVPVFVFAPDRAVSVFTFLYFVVSACIVFSFIKIIS